jgi:integrase
MAKETNKLSAVTLKKKMKPGKHSDGCGLYLEVTAEGGRYWRWKYRHGGKEKRLGFGVFPEVSLSDARQRRDEARKLLQAGTDPSEQRKTNKADELRAARGTFGAVCADWLAFKGKSWAPESLRKADYVARTYLLPKLKAKKVAKLESKDVCAVLKGIAEHAPDLARKARQYSQGIIRHAIREGLRDEGRLLILDDVFAAAKGGHIPAETMPEEIAALMKAVRAYPSEVTRAALLMCAYTAQRPGMVAAMRWDELALDAAEWRIPGERMKTRHAHIVPLPRQALALVEAMKAYTAGRDYVFPPLARQSTPHLHRDALSNALRRMGFAGKHATHGFRGMLRTAGRERLGIDSDVLEAQLAHAKRGNVQKAYDRTTFGDARVTAMQKWADWLDKLTVPATVTPIHKTAAPAA